MEFRLLGPVEVRDGAARLPLGGPKRRALLAVMLLNANRVVPVDRLIGAVWGESPPATATAQVQAAVSALRRALGTEGLDGERIITRPPGYLVRLQPGELDVELFERDADVARRALAEGDVEQAASGLRAALDWWRGAALSDLPDSSMQTLAVGLEERRMATLEERIEADLALGRHAALVAELTALIAENPLRERLRGQLMLALYRAGRQADALAAYRDTRKAMIDELGLEPGAELQRLERLILNADAGLDLRPAADRAQLAESGAKVRPPCPFRGLTAFGIADGGVFFGRQTEITELSERLHRPGPVTVVGPSGCGKSSLIFAGVLPELLRSADPPPVVVSFRPSDARNVYAGLAAALVPVLEPDPTQDGQLGLVPKLAKELEADGLGEVIGRALARASTERLVLVVDQAEELLAQHPEQVDRFAEHVFGAEAPDALTVMSTLRADFLDAALGRAGLSAPLRQSIYTLGAMTAEQLREVVTEPVTGTGVEFQDGLVDRILTDMGTDPGALPLLGLTLTLLWERQSDGALTHEAYHELGRVPGSLARYAEEQWRRSNLADEQDTARQLFTQLICVTEAGDVSRRVASKDALGEPRWELAQRLATSRLLVTGRDAEGRETVELAHEALVTGWARLRGWIEADRDFRQWQEGLRADLTRWERAERDPNLLVRGVALAEAQRWSGGRSSDLPSAEVDFIDRAAKHALAVARRRDLLRSALVLGVVLTVLLASLFVYQSIVANRESATATSQALAGASADWAERDAAYSALLALAAYQAQPTAEATTALFRPYLESQGASSMFSTPQAIVGGLPGLVSRDGRVVARGTNNRTVIVWTQVPGQEPRSVRTPILEASALIALAPDGSALWLVDGGWLSRFDTSSAELRRVTEVERLGTQHLAVSSDGRTVVVLTATDQNATRKGVVWDVQAGRRQADQAFPGGQVAELAVGADGRSLVVTTKPDGQLVAGDDRVEVWGIGDGSRRVVVDRAAAAAVATGAEVAVSCAQSSPTAKRFTTTRLADGAELGRFEFAASGGPCPSFATDPTGLTVVSHREFETADVLDLRSGKVVSRLRAPLLNDARLSPTLAGSGEHLQLVLSDKSRVALLDVPRAGATLPTLLKPTLTSAGDNLAGFAPDSSELRIYPVGGATPSAKVARPTPHWRPPIGPSRSVDASLLADRIAADRIAVRRLPSLELVRELTTAPVPPRKTPGDPQEALPTTALFFDQSNRLVVVVNHQIELWDPMSGERLSKVDLDQLGHTKVGEAAWVSSHPDVGRIVVVVVGRPDVLVLDVLTGELVDKIPIGDDAETALFQRGSSYVVIQRTGGVVEVWDARDKRRVLGPLVASSDSGRLIATLDEPGEFAVSDLGQYRIWHVGSAIPTLSVKLATFQQMISISGDGRTGIYIGGVTSEMVGVLRLNPTVWREHVCSVIGRRGFTEEERAGLPPGTPDQPLCP